jgi:hypothetical protein
VVGPARVGEQPAGQLGRPPRGSGRHQRAALSGYLVRAAPRPGRPTGSYRATPSSDTDSSHPQLHPTSRTSARSRPVSSGRPPPRGGRVTAASPIPAVIPLFVPASPPAPSSAVSGPGSTGPRRGLPCPGFQPGTAAHQSHPRLLVALLPRGPHLRARAQGTPDRNGRRRTPAPTPPPLAPATSGNRRQRGAPLQAPAGLLS